MQLTEVRTSDKPTRYFINGIRVSRDDYEYQITLARIQNRAHQCFSTRCKEVSSGIFKRWNYSHIQEAF